MPGVTTANIWNVHLSLCFNYSLSDIYWTDFKTLAVVDVSSSSGIARIDAFGTLELKQLTPLYTTSYKKTDYNENPLLGINNRTLTELLSSYYSWNESTKFEHQKLVYGIGNPETLEIDIEIVVPWYQEVQYQTGSLESLKHAWIQYVFILIPIWYFL